MDITSEKEILGNDDNNLEPKVEIEEIEIKTIGSDNSDNIHTSDVRSITSKNFYEEPLKFNTENTNTIELLAYNYNDNRTKDVPETFYDGSQRNGFIACIETLSDEKYIVFESNQSQSNFANEYSNNKFIKLLNNQKKPFNFERPTFLTNGDLFVISYENDQIYLFSLDPNEEVITCKAAYNISLPKLTASDNVAKYFIISNSYLLINNGDTMASQWDLTKMEFEFQYFSEILLPNNYYRYNSNAAIFNKDKSLLAVYLYVEKQLIIYSIQYGIKLTTFTFGKSKCDDMAFIYTKDNTEHLFVVLQNEYADIANNYILMDPYNLDNYTDINHYDKESGYLKLKLKVEKLTLSFVDEYDYFELCTHFLINCKVLENDDLLLITRLGIMIFSSNFIAKKIYLKYFWNDYIEQEKYWMRHTSNSYYIKKRISEGFDNFKKKINRLPSLNYYYIFDNYNQTYSGKDKTTRQPFKDMLSAILEDISSFTIFADEILKSALDNHKGSIVELVCDKCLSFLQQNPEMNIGLTTFLVNELPKLSKHYPGVVKKFLEQTSMLLDPSCDKIFVSNLPSHYGCCYDIDLYRDNLFWNLYFVFQRNYYKFMKIVGKCFDEYSIFSNNYGKYSLSLVDLSKQYEEIKNEFKNLQVNHAELKNQFDELKKELIKQFDINSKFMTYQLKEGNQHIIENILNQLLPQNRK
ncbi:14690_t:CDS:2 [Entrophospora sp. SA101]|nr:14690_t:CDS:2 [Entrophospora sp. SA101]